LNLADGCLRHKLLGYAAQEITAAMAIDAKNPRIALLEGRLQRDLSPPPAASPSLPVAATPVESQATVSSQDLERMVKTMPAGSVETFTTQIEPIWLNSCATAGCHGPNSTSKFTLIKPISDRNLQRRATQRNLFNCVQFVDHEMPSASKLLAAAREPHGDMT